MAAENAVQVVVETHEIRKCRTLKRPTKNGMPSSQTTTATESSQAAAAAASPSTISCNTSAVAAAAMVGMRSPVRMTTRIGCASSGSFASHGATSLQCLTSPSELLFNELNASFLSSPTERESTTRRMSRFGNSNRDGPSETWSPVPFLGLTTPQHPPSGNFYTPGFDKLARARASMSMDDDDCLMRSPAMGWGHPTSPLQISFMNTMSSPIAESPAAHIPETPIHDVFLGTAQLTPAIPLRGGNSLNYSNDNMFHAHYTSPLYAGSALDSSHVQSSSSSFVQGYSHQQQQSNQNKAAPGGVMKGGIANAIPTNSTTTTAVPNNLVDRLKLIQSGAAKRQEAPRGRLQTEEKPERSVFQRQTYESKRLVADPPKSE